MDVVLVYVLFVCFLFFKQKTAYDMRISDWTSDVCSSDLIGCRRSGCASSFPSEMTRYVLILISLNSNMFLFLSFPRKKARFSENMRRPPSNGQTLFAAIGRASCRERVCQYV